MAARQDSDNLAWDRSDELWEKAMEQVRLSSTCRNVESFAKRMLGQSAILVTPLIIGGFNVLYPITIEGSSDKFLVRLPCPGQAVFPEEKMIAEAATTACITQRTQLTVPKVFCHGVDPEIGPFMIIQEFGSRRGMGQAMEAPRKDPNEAPILNSNISESKLKNLYIQMGQCLLQLVQPTFPRIGALVEINQGSYSVLGRPVTLNMINMAQLSNTPKSVLPSKPLMSAKQGRLSNFGFSDDDWSASSKNTPASLPAPDGSGSFRLWSDDFRPSNVLVDENDQVLGAIDWEFTYAAPTQFVLDPPWWLLLDVPKMWEDGIEDWVCVYEKRLNSWLSAMEEAEQAMSSSSLLLSAYMRESWATGRFWLNYAARRSWAFDTIYWKYLDERFFGEREKDAPTEELWKARAHLLSPEERGAMEPMVKIKMEEAKDRVLVEWDAAEARQRLSSFLFD